MILDFVNNDSEFFFFCLLLLIKFTQILIIIYIFKVYDKNKKNKANFKQQTIAVNMDNHWYHSEKISMQIMLGISVREYVILQFNDLNLQRTEQF